MKVKINFGFFPRSTSTTEEKWNRELAVAEVLRALNVWTYSQ